MGRKSLIHSLSYNSNVNHGHLLWCEAMQVPLLKSSSDVHSINMSGQTTASASPQHLPSMVLGVP